MAENDFNTTVESLFRGMDSFITTKTVVGDAVKFDDGTIILPLVDVMFGVGAGCLTTESKKNSAGGGLGGKITPSSVLVLKNNTARLVNVRNQDTITKILDMVPDIVEKFTGAKEKNDEDEKIKEVVKESMSLDE